MGITRTRAAPAPAQDERTRRGRWLGFVAAGYTLVILLTGTNLPTPLYPSYEQQFGFSSLIVTLVFAIYALVLIPSLLVFGPLGDAIGRRKVLLPAVGVAAIGSLLFVFASGPAWLFAARAAQGLALGAVQGTAAAALVENEPYGRKARAAMVASASTAGGSALGPLVAGLLAQYAPAPLRLSYVVHLGLLVIAALVLLRMDSSGGGQRWRPRRPSVPAPIRRTFAVAGSAAFVAWAVTALFLALIPSYVTGLLHTKSTALAGGVVAVMLGCSALTQVCCRRLPSLTAQMSGLSLLLVGVAGLIAAGATHSVAITFAATILAGLGQGLAFFGSMTEVNAVAPPARRGDIVSSYYVVIYTGVAFPIIGAGLLALAVGLVPAVQIFGCVVGAACVTGLVVMATERHRPGRLTPAEEHA